MGGGKLSEQQNKKYCDQTLELEEGVRTVYMLLAERLYNIKNDRLYEPAWSSWYEFTMEFKDLSPASISKLISVYELFVLQYGFKQKELAKAGGWTKLYNIMKRIHSKADAENWLEKAETLSRQDLEKELVIAKTGIEMSECGHTDTYLVRVCRGCGLKVEEYEDKA